MKQGNRASREVNKFRDLARVVIKHHFGGAKRITYLSSGLTNFVFSFADGDGDYIIRISPDAAKVNFFNKEQWAVAKARAAGVPAPEILEVGFDLIGFPFMVSRTADGEEATHHPQRFDILRRMGRIAAKINSIKTKGFGQTFDWSDNQLSFNRTFKEYLYKEYSFEQKLDVLLKNKVLTPQRVKQVEKIFTAAARKHVRPVLNHSDIRLKNVIADDQGRINAIIDWEGCTSNFAPAWELSLALHDLGVDGVQHFLEGYGIKEKQFRDSLPLIRAFNIANYAAAVEQAAADKNKKLLEQFKLRLGGDLDLYSI